MNRYAEFPHQNKKRPCETHAGNAELINPCNQRSDEIRAECCPSQDNCEQRCSASNRSANCSSGGSKSNPQHAHFNQSLALRNSNGKRYHDAMRWPEGGTVVLRQSRQKDLKSCAKSCYCRASQPNLQWTEQSVSAVFNYATAQLWWGVLYSKKRKKNKPFAPFFFFFLILWALDSNYHLITASVTGW